MARGRIVEDLTTLQMALVGYELERRKIEDKIKLLQRQLKGKKVVLASSGGAAAKKAPATKRVLSPAARRRIAAAQRKRWAEHRKRQAVAAKE
jgi:hypothetical protein